MTAGCPQRSGQALLSQIRLLIYKTYIYYYLLISFDYNDWVKKQPVPIFYVPQQTVCATRQLRRKSCRQNRPKRPTLSPSWTESGTSLCSSSILCRSRRSFCFLKGVFFFNFGKSLRQRKNPPNSVDHLIISTRANSTEKSTSNFRTSHSFPNLLEHEYQFIIDKLICIAKI